MMRAILTVLLFARLSIHAAFYDNYDWEANAWRINAQTNGGTFGGNTYIAGTQFMKLLRQGGLRTRLLRVNIFAGVDALAAKAAIIHDVGPVLDAYTGGTPSYNETNGFSTGGAIATDFNPTNLTVNDAHEGIYLGGTAGAETAFAMGVTAFGGNDMYMTTCYTGFGQLVNLWVSTGRPAVTDTDGRGYYVGTRTSSATTGVGVFRNGLRTGTSTSVGGNPPDTGSTGGMFIKDCNAAGSGIGGTTKPCRGYQLGRGLTDAQVSTFYVIWQRTQLTISPLRVQP
jgi:hypothetical protein